MTNQKENKRSLKEIALDGTEGKQIEEALKDCDENKYGVCLSCGKDISTAHLKKHPTAELCTHCVRKGHKTGKKKTTHV